MMVTFEVGALIKAQLGVGVNATLSGVTAADTIATSSSRGPIGAGSNAVKPDIAAPGVNITAAQTGITCVSGGCLTPDATGFLPDNQPLTISGTSMAAPHMAGIMALLKQRYPGRSPEELKAMAMNGALHDVTQFANGAPPRLGPDRVGAGRTDPVNSLALPVSAFNADEPGVVSLSYFGEVVGTQTQTKRVRVVNNGLTAQTYDLSLDTSFDAPGIAFSLPGGSSVTVPPGGTVFVNVQVSANAALMDHVRDPSAEGVQAAPAPLTSLGALPRHYLTNESSYLTFAQAGTDKLRVPLYAAMRPASAMSAPATIVTGAAPSGSTTIPLSGADVCTGTLVAGPDCTAGAPGFPISDVSRVTPFELQATHPRDPTLPASANIRNVGVAFDSSANVVMFGLSTWGDWGSLRETTFNVYIDNNNDGTFDRILFNSDPGTMGQALFGTAGAGAQDTFITATFNLATNGVGTQQFINRSSAASTHSVVFNNNVIVLAATAASLGIPAGGTFKYKVQTCPGFAPLCGPINGFFDDEVAGPFTWSSATQGLNFNSTILAKDLNGATLPVAWNTANMTANGTLGALLLHHHNASGQRDEVVVLDTAQTADIAITQSIAPPAPLPGQNVTITLVVTNNGPNAATSVVATDVLPAGLTYVSDDGGGLFDNVTGIWIVGPLANGGSATLNIVATVNTSGIIENTAQVGSGSPSDTVPENNQASAKLGIGQQTTLSITKSGGTPTALVGASISYTVTVQNTGVDTAFDVVMTDVFPAYPALQATSFVASGGTFVPATGVWSIASIAAGGTETLVLTLNAPNIAGPLVNQGTVAASNAGCAISCQASATIGILSPATVTATKTAAGTFARGSTVTYTVVLSNSSAYDQQNNPGSEFTDVLPPPLTLVGASATAGTAVATIGTNTVTWDGVVPGNGTVTITITATVLNSNAMGATISNQGTARYDADGEGTNEASAFTDDPGVGGASDPTSFVVREARVSGTKTAAGFFSAGTTVTYTVVLSNTGNAPSADSPGNEFTDVLPATLTLVSASATAGTAVAMIGTNTVTWNGGVAAGGSVTITITATINAGAMGTVISNQGTIAYDSDLNGTNEAGTVTDDPAVGGAIDPTSFTVLQAIVAATKNVSGYTFAPGDLVTYTIVLANTGNAASPDSPGDELTDVLPAGLSLTSASATAGTAVANTGANTVTWNGSVPAGGSVTITINATVNANASGTLSNQGIVIYDSDLNGSNETTVLTDDPRAPGAAPGPTIIFVQARPIPALDLAGMIVLGLALFGLAGMALRRRNRGLGG
ncbi:MAG: DUF11 domain-containing protein [Burkholderiales bacterium]|nr:DUF11 domain-containing protein [Burkholderiales bacterium]